MAIFEWDDSIALGIPVIDQQHKALFGLVNKLNEALHSGDGAEATGEVIGKLITYVTEHFNDEERLMLSCNFPYLAEHRTEHDTFVSRLRQIQADFTAGHEMGGSVLDFMVDWLVCHIKGTDQKYNRFINEQAHKG